MWSKVCKEREKSEKLQSPKQVTANILQQTGVNWAVCPCTFIKLIKGKGQGAWQSPGGIRSLQRESQAPAGQRLAIVSRARAAQRSPRACASVSVGQLRQGAIEGVFKPLVHAFSCVMSHVYLWRKLKRELPPFLVNSAPNGTLFEVLVGKM